MSNPRKGVISVTDDALKVALEILRAAISRLCVGSVVATLDEAFDDLFWEEFYRRQALS